MFWNKLEKRLITEKRDGAVYKTKIVGYEWFASGQGPECYVEDSEGFIWVATLDSKVAADKPESVIL